MAETRPAAPAAPAPESLSRAVLEAEARIRPQVRVTPVELAPVLGAAGRCRVHLKLENLQATGSFKLRGAMNKLMSLPAAQRERGIVTASSGNHGAAVAYTLGVVGGRGTVFVPENCSPVKVAAIRTYGGAAVEVKMHATDSGTTEVFARAWAAERGLAYVSPYNDPDIVAGQGTVGAEMLAQIDALDAVFVALGGGGLVSGIGAVLKAALPGVAMIACSPENSAVMHHSMAAGRVLDLESKPTLSDGTAGRVEQGTITLELCRRYVDRSVLVTEDAIKDAVRFLIERHHTLVEGAAGVAVAGYLAHASDYAGKNVAIVLCGANIAPEKLKTIL